MNAGKRIRSSDRLERVSRGVLAIALLIAVAWAVMGTNARMDLFLSGLWG